MIFMLDTNACIEHLRNPACNVGMRMSEKWRDEFVISAITEFELLYGAANSQNPKAEEAKVHEFLSRFESVPFGRHAAAMAGQLRSELEATGNVIGPFDLLIAATALIRGATLVTHNVGEFARVPHLEWEDWH
jgi:tRNA(fMet)-specific endonuclease VapC